MTLEGALEIKEAKAGAHERCPFGGSGEWTAWRSALRRAARLAHEAPKLVDDVTESKVARCEQKVGPRAITGGQPFPFAVDTLRSSMSGDGDRRRKSSRGLLRPSLEGSKVVR